MRAHPFAWTTTNLRQTLVRYRRPLALGLLCVAVALAAYRFSSVPPVATSVVSVAPASDTDPAQQGVLGYLRAHQSVAEPRPHAHTVVATPPLDPAQQGVQGYLRAHAAVETPPLDPRPTEHDGVPARTYPVARYGHR